MKIKIIIEKVLYKAKFANRIINRFILFLRGINYPIFFVNFIALTFLVFIISASLNTISQWQVKYNEIAYETSELKSLHLDLQEKQMERDNLENNEYMKIKAKEANIYEEGAILYKIDESTKTNVYIEEEGELEYKKPPTGVKTWLNLLY